MRKLSILLIVLALCLLLVPAASAQHRSNYCPTYSSYTPSYYYPAYQPTYYQPVYYQPYSYSYAPPKKETTSDDLLKELLIKKLAADLGVSLKPEGKQPALTPDEVNKLRALLPK